MSLDVFCEVKSLCAGVVALFATERFFSRMGSHVSFEGTGFCGGVVALFANKGFLSTVNQHVLFQISSFDGVFRKVDSNVNIIID